MRDMKTNGCRRDARKMILLYVIKARTESMRVAAATENVDDNTEQVVRRKLFVSCLGTGVHDAAIMRLDGRFDQPRGLRDALRLLERRSARANGAKFRFSRRRRAVKFGLDTECTLVRPPVHFDGLGEFSVLLGDRVATYFEYRFVQTTQDMTFQRLLHSQLETFVPSHGGASRGRRSVEGVHDDARGTTDGVFHTVAKTRSNGGGLSGRANISDRSSETIQTR